MNPTIDILRAELERLFSLDEMTSMSQRLLGLDPHDVGGVMAKASFAKALTERCIDGDRIDALVDVIVATRTGVDPRIRETSNRIDDAGVEPGTELGPFVVTRKIGEGDVSIVYAARRDGKERVVKMLRREARRDRAAVQRFLTANRMMASIGHGGLPKEIEPGEGAGSAWVSYSPPTAPDTQPLSARFARTGPARIDQLKPLLMGILEPLAALHKARMAHGALKLENVLVGRDSAGGDGGLLVTLIDFGTDRLRHQSMGSNGHASMMTVFGSPKTIAPEQIRGQRAELATDVYAFGAMVYELLSGKPVFSFETVTDAAFAHVTMEPEPPSSRAPRGWISSDVDDFVLSLLAKEPERRPKNASALLDALDWLARGTARGESYDFPEEKLTDLVDRLVSAPEDADAAIALERAIEDGADATRVADAFEVAASSVEAEDADGLTAYADDGLDVKKSLLFRAARVFETSLNDKKGAERVYDAIVRCDPKDDIARSALDEIRKSLGKYAEVVESLMSRSEEAGHGEERGRLFAEIGRLCASELDDSEQGVLAYTRALCEMPSAREYSDEIERLASARPQLWNEVLATLTESASGETLSSTEQNELLAHAGRWYDEKVGRADLGLLAYRKILARDPANEEAHEGLTHIYQKAQQWPELVAVLEARANASGSLPRARDLRADAGEVYEQKLNNAAHAKEMYARVLAEDPGHPKAADGMVRIAQRTGDFDALVAVLERRAESRRGREKIDTMLRLGRVYEDDIEDLGEATRHYGGVLELEPHELQALKGLERIYGRTGKYRELLTNLELQVSIAATPRQKVTLYERMATLHDEEFLDHARAADCLELVLGIDPTNDSAMTALPRHYRALGEWEQLERLYDTHAALVSEEGRRIDLMVHRARVLSDNIGSPDRATQVYEDVLALLPAHSGALEALARLRELTGDANAALSAIEALAAQATTPDARAELWVRAARLLEGHGDRDGAIERYKLALEASPKDAAAGAALRQAYAARGEASSVVALIEKELELAESQMARARLYAELARVQREKLRDDEAAERNARTAVDLDPTNSDALLVLGDIAFEQERYAEASKYLEPLVGGVASLPKANALRILARFVESYGHAVAARAPQPDKTRDSAPPPSKSVVREHPRLAAAVETLEQIAPDDAEALLRVGRVLLDCGDAVASRRAFEHLLARHGEHLSPPEHAEALWRLGESLRRVGDLERAVERLKEAAEIDPSSSGPLEALGLVYEQTGNWEELIRTKQSRLDVATGGERFDLLLDIGDVEFSRLNDRARASKTYVAALEERPDDRKLLTKLMQLYSEEKDWANLVEVVLRLADFVDDPKQRAKYLHTAAIITSRQLGDIDDAIHCYDRALEFDPTLSKAADEAVALRLQKGDHEGVERLLKAELAQAKQTEDRDRIVAVLDKLGELYRTRLNEPELAIDAYEAAQAFDPEGKERADTLAELYASDVTKYLDKAVKAQAQILRRNPFRLESYKLLRRLYTEARRPDPAWCLCQALSVLNRADPDEERFYRRHRTDNAARAQAVLDEQDWTERLAHPDADPLVTRVFAAIQPTIIRARTQPLSAMGYDPAHRMDIARHTHPVTQTLYYVQGVFGYDAPPVFPSPNDAGGLGFVHAQTPAIVLGRAAFDSAVPNQSLAFIAARHVAYFRPGFYVRHLVPTGTGLKAWLFAAIKLCIPQFPIAPDLEGQVDDAMTFMAPDFHGVQREMLASTVSKLLQSGGAIDLKKWVAAIDLTADRAGFLLAHDLGVAVEVIRATEDAASVSVKERIKELVLFSIGEHYFGLREKLQITVES